MAKSVFSFSPSTVKSVINAFSKASKAELTAKQTRNQAGQKMVDDLTVSWPGGDKAKFFEQSKARAACLEVFTACDGLSESAVKNYPMSVKLAFVHGIAFEASLFTKQGKEAAGIATPSAGTANDGASGTVKTTNKAALFKTLSKALAQARLLDDADFVGDLTDTIQDHYPDFKETVLDK
jgi:hypothetical protein